MCTAIVSADTPQLRKFLLIKCFSSSSNDKNAVQAKHIRKVGLAVLLHRIVTKVSRDYSKSESWTVQKKHDGNFGKFRISHEEKLVRFKKERFHSPPPPPAYATGAHLCDSALGDTERRIGGEP